MHNVYKKKFTAPLSNPEVVRAPQTERDQLDTERAKLLYRLFPPGQASSALVIIILIISLWSSPERPWLTAWLVLSMAVILARFALYARYMRITPTPAEARRWIRYFTVGAGLMGITWSLLAVKFFPLSDVSHQLLIIFVIGGVSVGAIGVLSASPGAYLAYVLPAMLPLSFELYAQHDATYTSMCLFLVVYTLSLLGTFRMVHRNLIENIRIKLKNEHLTKSLSLMQRIEEINQELASEVGERKRVEDRMRHLAYHDALTGLPNRSLLKDQLGKLLDTAQLTQQQVGVLFIDLDRFKTINDSLGHAAGDQLLRLCTERLARCLRHSDIIARPGGDEFVVVLPNLQGTPDAVQVANHIVESMVRPFDLNGHQVHVSCSIGISVYPGDGDGFDSLLKNADAAMYAAKSMVRGGYQFFTPQMAVQARQRLSLEGDMHEALQHGEFVLHYQPELDLECGKVVAVEALVRWQHPQQGLLAPDRFIPIAEETGFIGTLGEWVIKTACAQLKAWQDEGIPSLCLAVNVSPHQFRRGNFVQMLQDTLSENGLPASHLELEITENTLLLDDAHTIDILLKLSAMGVGIVIDDFGVGYSNLAYLKRFTINKIKIDRSFIVDMEATTEDADLVSAIIAMGHSLKHKVVAEGVETVQQRARLQTLGCDYMQGYLACRPLAAEPLLSVLRNNAWHFAHA
ncbi:MAG: EAL domain-containing protein [Gammaproteobacteria bacterium]